MRSVTRTALRPTERPLEDSPRAGPELWREIFGVLLCDWDRWLLQLALDEAQGLRGMRASFRAREDGDR